MVKIKLLEPTFNSNGTIYYCGFINGVYTHFLGYDKLKKKEIKELLLKTYKNKGHLEV